MSIRCQGLLYHCAGSRTGLCGEPTRILGGGEFDTLGFPA